jgi:hypothetical protein
MGAEEYSDHQQTVQLRTSGMAGSHAFLASFFALVMISGAHLLEQSHLKKNGDCNFLARATSRKKKTLDRNLALLIHNKQIITKLSSHRHSHIHLIFSSRFIDS